MVDSPALRPAQWLIPRASTFVFNHVQLGLAVYAATKDLPRGALLLLAFEFGIFGDSILRVGAVWQWAIAGMGAAIMLIIVDMRVAGPETLPLLVVSIGFIALSLKKIRTATDALGTIKRRWRNYGYLSAGLFSLEGAASLVFLMMLIAIFGRVGGSTDRNLRSPISKGMHLRVSYAAIFLHHLHYFSYTYLVVIILIKRFDVSALVIGPLFLVGWLGYYHFASAQRGLIGLIVAGHIAASAAAFGLLSSSSLLLFLALWFVTGLGGGTIILLRNLITEADPTVYDRFKFWEAVGHIAGLGVFCTAIYIQHYALAFTVALVSGLLCASAVLVVSVLSVREERFGVRRAVAVDGSDGRT